MRFQKGERPPWLGKRPGDTGMKLDADDPLVKEAKKPPRLHPKLWERHKGEPYRQYYCFLLYRNLGPEREFLPFLKEMQRRQPERSPISVEVSLRNTAKKRHWEERCEAWDLEQQMKARGLDERSLLDSVHQRISLGVAMQERIQEALENQDLSKLSPKQLAELNDIFKNIEEEARKEEREASVEDVPAELMVLVRSVMEIPYDARAEIIEDCTSALARFAGRRATRAKDLAAAHAAAVTSPAGVP